MTDNKTSEAWTHKACTSSSAGKALGRVFCNLLLNNRLGINAQYLEGARNIIADRISRIHKNTHAKFDFGQLLQEFPQLGGCRRFHPSQELLLAITTALSKKQHPNLQQIKVLGRLEAVSATT